MGKLTTDNHPLFRHNPPMRPVSLVHPPQAKACEPPPGLLALAGFLGGRGIPVSVFDANLAVQEALLAPAALARAAGAAGAQGPAATSARRAARRAPAAVAALRDPATYRAPGAYRGALEALTEGWRSVSRSRGLRLGVSDLEHPTLSPLSSADLVAVFTDEAALGLGPELAAAARAVLADDPGVVGVSATYLSQALPSFALAGALRRVGFRGPLVLGGGVVTSWAPRLTPASPLFRAWDALVVGPGEAALEALARGGRRAPGLLAPALGAWDPPGAQGPRPLCFHPDPKGWPWGRYLAPGPVVPLATSRGCYWRRCAFCPEAAQDGQPFRAAPHGTLVAAALRARDEGGARWLHLTDDAVPPAALGALARGLADQNLRWYGFARLEPTLREPAFADELARGGCAMLQLGIETASQDLLDAMGKGTRAADAGPIVQNLARAGIRTFGYLLFGFPGETPADAAATVAWAAAHGEHLTYLNLAVMSVPRGSPLEAPGPGAPGEPDLSLYRVADAEPAADRRKARAALAAARAHPALRPILARTPPGFTSNHGAFAPLEG